MKVANPLIQSRNTENVEGRLRIIEDALTFLNTFAQGRVRFGAGVDGERGENLSGEWQVFTSDATPDTEFTVTHTVGSVPIGIIVAGQDKAGSLYQLDDTGTAWTATSVFLKSDVASVEFRVFLLK